MTAELPWNIASALNEIAERLWSGHASVMVGAGFSKNASRNSNSSRPFPSWNELADLFYEKLHNDQPSSQSRYLNPLKLAEEYCAEFGRSSLEALIRSSIPDQDYSPSELHRELMELPWNDIFTTNYDTLLERTQVSQRFDKVLCSKDLVFSRRPRIIKLHGSFSSSHPLIVTEEDYRTYPQQYAPFVNTVQQSLIENTLCLIGFSGEDPNFLRWIGWIRDNLGSSVSAKIYLIGVLNLSPSQTKVLQGKHIGIIDFSSYMAQYPDKYKKALQIFISYLRSKRSDENRLDWPDQKTPSIAKPPYDASEAETVEALSRISQEWRKVRLEYPGWVICPRSSRERLRGQTSMWETVRRSKLVVPLHTEIPFLGELIWRHARSLRPLDDELVEAIEKSLLRYESASEEIQALAEYVLDIRFQLLKFYREEGLKDKWDKTFETIKASPEPLTSSQKDELRYEKCLQHLFQQEMKDFRSSLQSWRPHETAPYFEARKAGLLAECGWVDEAIELLEKALKSVHGQLNLAPITTDYSSVSQESYILQLLQFARDAKNWQTSKGRNNDDDYDARWAKLQQYKCDPWRELDLFEAELRGPPAEFLSRETTFGFDIGHASTVNRIGVDSESLKAFAFLKYIDAIGIPYRIQNCTFGKHAAMGAIPRIVKYSPHWALATLLRVGDSKGVDELFDRESIAGIPQRKIDSLIDLSLRIMADLKGDIEEAVTFTDFNIGTNYASIVPEVLSRLCTRASFEDLRRILDFLIVVYRSPHRLKYSDMKHLAKRVIASWPSQHVPSLFARIILEIPVATDGPREFFDFPDPLKFLPYWELKKLFAGKAWISDSNLQQLIGEFENADGETRNAMGIRLFKAYHAGLIRNEEEVTKLGRAFWKKIDSTGFPVSDLLRACYLELPCPAEIDIKAKIKPYLLALNFPATGLNRPLIVDPSTDKIFNELLYAEKSLRTIHWMSADALMVLVKIYDWWDLDRPCLQEKDLDIFGDRERFIRSRLQHGIKVLALVVLPFLSPEDLAAQLEKILTMLCAMKERGIQVAPALAMLVRRNCYAERSLIRLISRDMLSQDPDRARESMEAARLLLSVNPGSELLGLIADTIKWRKMPALLQALWLVKDTIANAAIDWGDFMDHLLIGLHDLIAETRLSFDGPLPLHERLVVREEAASLAFHLYRYHWDKNLPIPEELNEWKTIVADPGEFAEIRNKWLEA